MTHGGRLHVAFRVNWRNSVKIDLAVGSALNQEVSRTGWVRMAATYVAGGDELLDLSEAGLPLENPRKSSRETPTLGRAG